MTKANRFLTVSALALTAGFFGTTHLQAGPAQPGDIIIAQAQSSDPGSRLGDAPGTIQPVPAPGAYAPNASPGPGTATGTGPQLGDVSGTTQPVPAPAARAPGSTNPGGGSGAQLGDVSGTQQPTGVPGAIEAPSSSTNQRSVAVPTQCAGEPTEQARTACMKRSSAEQGKPGGR